MFDLEKLHSIAAREKKKKKGSSAGNLDLRVGKVVYLEHWSVSAMENIVFVSPQLFLGAGGEWKSSVEKTGFIPILKADVGKLEVSLQKVVDRRNGLIGAAESRPASGGRVTEEDVPGSSGRSLRDVGAKETSTTGSGASKVGTSLWTPIKEFSQCSQPQQLRTIAVRGLGSNIKNSAIDTLLGKTVGIAARSLSLVLEDSSNPKIIESWSNVTSSSIGNQDIFMRFNQEFEGFPQMVSFLKSLVKGALELHYETGVKEYIENSNVEVQDPSDEDISQFKALFDEASRDVAGPGDASGEESLFQYDIDMSTLNDIPPEDLEQLCRDIREFRMRVVTIEKENTRKEALSETERQRGQMMKMFEEIKTHQGNKELQTAGNNDQDMVEEDLSMVYNFQSEQEIAREAEKRYKDLLRRLNNVIEPTLKKVSSELTVASNYEEQLVKKKSLLLKEITHLGNDPLYDHHRSFKEREEIRDKEDRDVVGDNVSFPSTSGKKTGSNEEVSSHADTKSAADKEASTGINIKLSFNQNPDKGSLNDQEDITPNSTQEAEEVPSGTGDIPKESMQDMLPFTDDDLAERLSRLRKSKFVDELVNEYLGVYEDELVDYIFENISENKSKAVLLADLKETFDDDAVIMADKIWQTPELLK